VAAVGQTVLAFPLHSTILEPDFDLTLGEAEGVRDLDAPAPGQVPVEVELLLKLERLIARVGCPRSLRVVVSVRRRQRQRRRRLVVTAAAGVRRYKQNTQTNDIFRNISPPFQ